MTASYAHRQWSPIGAIELKESYRRNMTIAALLIILAMTLSIGTWATVQALTPVIPVGPTDTLYVDVTRILPPPITNKPSIDVAPITQPPKIDVGGILPFPDDSVFDDFTLPTKADYTRIDTSGFGAQGDGSQVIFGGKTLPDTVLPGPGVFVAYDENPMAISLPTPHYPEIARKAELEGRVWVEVLIDIRGKVQDARLVKGSGINAGFEEAALEAAWKGEWRPAMQNKQPVAVRVSYEVVFRLK
jgi:TonB family protein